MSLHPLLRHDFRSAVTGAMYRPAAQALQLGVSLIELLVTVVIVAIALLGLLGLQSRLHTSNFESYQRSVVLMLLDDISSRITANRAFSANYVTTTPLGAGMTCAVVTNTSTRQQIDTAEWCRALQGAAEKQSGNSVGAITGGRGCIEALPNNEYLITVAWQGMIPLVAPPASVGCGANAYDDATTTCVSDLCRRTITTIVRVGNFN